MTKFTYYWGILPSAWFSSIITICSFFFLITNISLAGTIYVSIKVDGPGDGSQLNPYRTITLAVDAAAKGDVIILENGVYNERLIINTPLTLKVPGGPAIIGELFKGQIRLLTHNVFGKSEWQCELRANRFGELVAHAEPPYDIVALQEYYHNLFLVCDAEHLSDAIWSTGRYQNSDNYYRFYPEGEWLQFEVDGGIGIFTLHPIIQFDECEWDNSGCGAVHGFVFARILIPGTSLMVDTYNVHLLAKSDGCDQECRKAELQQLAGYILKHSRYSNNPVLIMGDFNIGGPPTYQGNPGYEDIMTTLGNPTDLWMSAHPNDPGYTNDCQENTITDCLNSDRIDYIFLLTDPNFTNSAFDINITNPEDVKVVKYRIVSPPYGHYVSDHFGVEATIQIRERVSE